MRGQICDGAELSVNMLLQTKDMQAEGFKHFFFQSETFSVQKCGEKPEKC